MTSGEHEPERTVPLQIPAVRGVVPGVSQHRPGFDDTDATAGAEDAAAYLQSTDDGLLTAVVPPRAPEDAPRTSLSEQVIARLYGDGGTSS